MSSERSFDTNFGGDLLAMGFDVVLALDTHRSRKSIEEQSSLEISSSVPTENNLGYGDVLLHRFEEDLNEGDIAQLTDLTYSLPKGDSESAQSFLAKIACQDLARELGSTQISPQKATEENLFNSMSDNNDHCSQDTNISSLKTPLHPVDVYGRVSLYEGKLILQLKHFNANTSYPLNVSECWLCREKMSNGSQIHSHKHALQGLFQVNDEFVQMDIDHYIIPDQALDPDPPPDKNLMDNTLIDNVNSGSLEHIDDCRALPLEDINKCSQSLEVNLDTKGETLQNSENDVINSSGELNNSKPHEIEYSAVEFHHELNPTEQSLNSDIPINSNSFLNAFTNTDLRIEPVVSSDIVETQSDSIIINHVTETISPTSVNSFPSSTIVLPTCNNNNSTISNSDTLISRTCITETHSTQTDMTSMQQLCSSNSDPRGEDSFIQHTTYEPNIGNKDQLENYQNFFGNPYSYEYESNVLNTSLPKVTQSVRQTIESVALCNNSPINQSSTSESIGERKKAEVGAKRRKSKTQKKVNQVKIENNILPVDNFAYGKENLTKEIFTQSEMEESVIAVNISKHSIPNTSRETELTPNSGIDSDSKNRNPAHDSLRTEYNICCPFCSENFSSGKIQNFKEHLRGHKFDETYVFICPVCSVNISGSVKYIKHIRTHNGKRHFCTKCDANYSRAERLQNHVMNVHGTKKKFVCEYCSESFSRLEYLKKHKNIHLGYKFECDICHKLYSTLFNLQYHKKSHANEKMPYPCTHCDKAYLRKDLLHHHTTKEHKNKRYRCDICSKMYSRKDVLRRHKDTHDDKKISINCDNPKKNQTNEKLPYSCNHCEKAYLRKDLLHHHIIKEHKGKRYRCDICSKMYSRKDVLRRHKDTHDDKRVSFNCDICNKKFCRKDSLKAHSYKHQDKNNKVIKGQLNSNKSNSKDTLLKKEKQQKHQCNICSKYLPSSLRLEKHLQWHQNQMKLKTYFDRECMKTFKCDTCSRSFRTKELMKRHILRSHHSKSEPIQLSSPSVLKEPIIQNEKINNNNNNSNSDNVNNNNKKFICEVCSKGFTRSSNLKIHLETHLKKDADDDNILAEIPDVLKACRSNSLKELITLASCQSPVINRMSKENTSNVSGLHLLLDGNLVTQNSSFTSSFPTNLPTTFCTSPNSPMNLSTEAMGAAAYLLTNSFYEGTYQ